MSAESGTRKGILIFFVTAVTVAGGMFVFKLFSFLSTIRKDELAGFAFDPIVTYGFVAAGFLCLLGWAISSGQFRQLENAKHTMLRRVMEQEKSEGYLTLEDRRVQSEAGEGR